MVRAYHVIFSTYGFWLPNDPRGSGSDRVAAPHLRRFGTATKVQTRHCVANECHDHFVRTEAKRSLKYPPVIFDGVQARAVARGFADVLRTCDYPVYACTILPEHVHLVIGRHTQTIERIVAHLKRGATLRLFAEEIHPLIEFPKPVPSPWSKRTGWTVYLNDDQSVRHRIKYVEENPLKEGKSQQHWSFVKPFCV
jgi:REP element-mobilizing transposase RayT